MNCREAQHQLFAERDSASDSTRRAALDGHVAECADCQRIRDDLVLAFATWRADATNVVVPDSEREWHEVRRKIRGGATASSAAIPPRRNWLSWVAVPLGAAAALTLALSVTRQTTELPVKSRSAPQVARADSVEAPGNNASTMVFVDDKSGWLIVWASDAPKQG